MKTIKRAIAVLLAIVLVSSSFVCFAESSEKQYHKYEKVLLLGDSEASGFTDYGDEFSEFNRVDDSYAAYVADFFGAEFYPMACPGFRTIELRTLLDDNYIVDDPYLFTQVPHTPEAELRAKAPAVRQAVADTDMIIIGIGGNDWGAYLGWTLADVEFENQLPEEFKTQLREYLKTASFEDDIIGKIVELADYLNAVDDIAAVLPEAATYAFSTLHENWNWLIEYFYEKNPDVTIVAMGMFPTYLKTEEGAPDVVSQPDPITAAIEDAMIALGNMHMINNQEKYGYIYVDTAGTVVEICHPTVAGHRFLADRILEELPDARYDLTDVTLKNAEYKAVEYMYVNGLMNGTADKKFNGNAAMTKADFSTLMNNMGKTYIPSDSTKAVTLMEVKLAAFVTAEEKTINDLFNLLKYFAQIFFTNDAFAPATRMDVATEFYSYVK